MKKVIVLPMLMEGHHLVWRIYRPRSDTYYQPYLFSPIRFTVLHAYLSPV